ncbi:vWA domain-containing protein [Photobacterium leiognathi]|uniref:vWA domain-containing protein n=1 Tax=Photobacterium leiognathi TaxID=553611 RepID=UPI00298129DC|nr:pilus assembly protein TadG-related protein [Photobacterium leiognathi]
MKKQQGVAAIILVLILIPLFGCVFFALEGTRYIQKKTRLADASEAAAIALTEQNPNGLNIITSNNVTKKNDETLVRHYINNYIRNINNQHIKINTKDNGDFYQYGVDITTEHKSWFYNSLIPSFHQYQKINEKSLARKYYKITFDENVDLVFVTDFSYSMDFFKIFEPLKEALKKISIIINNENIEKRLKNRIAVVPFDLRTQDNINSERSCVTRLTYKKNNQLNYKYNRNYINYSDINWNNWVNHNRSYLYKIVQQKFDNVKDGDFCYLRDKLGNTLINSHDEELKYPWSKHYCSEIYFSYGEKYNGYYTVTYDGITHDIPYTKIQKEAFTILDVIEKSEREITTSPWDDIKDLFFDDNEYPDPLYYVDIGETINNMFSYKDHSSFIKGNVNLFNSSMCKKNFWTIPLTTNITNENGILEQIEDMEPGGHTAIYQGILRGAEILNSENGNKNKIMILISDGQEAPFTDTLKKLVDANMCMKIKQHFEKHQHNFYMGMIGIGYNAKNIESLQRCLGPENIINVSEVNKLTDEIYKLIAKGQKSSGITKLSDGQN